jgi:tetratricopeptide (TPR) repeat protein
MDSGFEGKVGLQRLPDLLRDIAFKGLTGVLRLSRDKTIKSIVFQSGQPVNAFSSIASERLDTRLIKEGRTTAGLVAAATRRQPDPTLLGTALVEKGIVSAEVMKKAASELAGQISRSVFEWTEAEYQFEETEQVACPRVMEISTSELIVEAVRQATSNVAFLDLVAPSSRLVTRSQTAGDEGAASAKLNATEGYILSVINDLTSLSEMEVLSGLPDEHTRPAVCVLIALGLLNTVDEPADRPAPVQPHHTEPANDEVIRGISRKLRLFETATYYEILGVDKLATTAAVNRAYQQLEAMFEAHRADYADRADVQRQLEELLGKIKAAHQVLGNPSARREYDRPPAAPAVPPPSTHSIQGTGQPRTAESGRFGPTERSSVRKPVPIPLPELKMPVAPPNDNTVRIERSQPAARPGPPGPASAEPIIERGQASESRNTKMQLPARTPIKMPELKMPVAPRNDNSAIERGQPDATRREPAPSRPAGPMTRPPAVLTPEERARLKKPDHNDEQALHSYRQGLMRYERRELDAATHLFREAVRLDPSQAHYHFYLGLALSIQAHARHEHQHHEGCHVTCKLGGALGSNPKVRYEAEQHFLRAAELEPSNTQYPQKLGELYKEAGLLKKAEHYFEHALMLDSKNHVAKRELERLRSGGEEDDFVDEELEVEVR